MLEYLKKILFSKEKSEDSTFTENHDRKIQIATCALLVEIARSDQIYDGDERKNIISLLQTKFNLSDEAVHDLIDLSEQSVRESISIYEFISPINETFSADDKKDLLKNLWRIVFSDKKLDKYEDNLMKRIGGMLNLDHKEIIASKMMIKQEFGL
ncbi:MAG: TerB family tellurite resistance protein [Ignavibacteriaceae bacterium]|nr:TerB family tellurite resistance protein [Ignavibacteriaceae bacterium]